MSQNDPTDHALAAIASILDQPQSAPDVDGDGGEKPPRTDVEDADGYVKFGPGPVAAMRFQWAVRREHNGGYFVDETVGDNSRPITSGPMSKEAAIRMVDQCSDEAQQRFDSIKSEMTGVRKESG